MGNPNKLHIYEMITYCEKSLQLYNYVVKLFELFHLDIYHQLMIHIQQLTPPLMRPRVKLYKLK